MNQSTENAKDLIINGVVYAKYLMEDDLIYIKVLEEIVPDDAGGSEDVCIQIISLIEKRKFKGAAFLNQ